jgi:hypothetical protein
MTQIFTLYDKNTGRILGTYQGTENSVPDQETESVGVLTGQYSLSSVVDINTKEVKQLPAQNNPFEVFNYAIEQWEVAPILLVAERNKLLKESDWTQLPDVPLVTKAAWAEYRQALRDITSQAGFPANVVWPTPPQ